MSKILYISSLILCFFSSKGQEAIGDFNINNSVDYLNRYILGETYDIIEYFESNGYQTTVTGQQINFYKENPKSMVEFHLEGNKFVLIKYLITPWFAGNFQKQLLATYQTVI